MNEDEWFEAVEERLEEKGVGLDSNNDGWQFMFENGFTPTQAVSEMLGQEIKMKIKTITAKRNIKTVTNES